MAHLPSFLAVVWCPSSSGTHKESEGTRRAHNQGGRGQWCGGTDCKMGLTGGGLGGARGRRRGGGVPRELDFPRAWLGGDCSPPPRNEGFLSCCVSPRVLNAPRLCGMFHGGGDGGGSTVMQIWAPIQANNAGGHGCPRTRLSFSGLTQGLGFRVRAGPVQNRPGGSCALRPGWALACNPGCVCCVRGGAGAVRAMGHTHRAWLRKGARKAYALQAA